MYAEPYINTNLKGTMITENYSLKNNNTFGLDVKARYFASPASVEMARDLILDPVYGSLPKLVLGAGSNILFTDDYNGLVIKPYIKDISISGEDKEFVWLRSGAGVVWDDFVSYCVDRGWGGVENLSWIPGTVGAAPVQNIGAYGAEAGDIIDSVEYIDMKSGKLVEIRGEECHFGYRDSVFKHSLKSVAMIVYVTFRLNKKPVLNTRYADLSEYFGENAPSLQDVREAVIEIRKKKLPDPAVTGNAGSFFKNPVVPAEQAERLKRDNPSLKLYPAGEGYCKLPAAWLIDQCGFKGKRVGNAGVHMNQALVLLAYQGATASELLLLADEIMTTVKRRFGVDISPEVNIC